MREFRERFYRSGPLRIHFRDWGALDAPPLVLVHGLRDHSHSFDDLARGLSRDYRVYAADLRGHGDSETTPYYAFGHFVGDLRNLVRALRLERPVVVGHSFGGEVVGQWAGAFPDVPRAVVILEGLGPPPHPMKWRVARHRMAWNAVDRAQRGVRGLPDLEAAYKRLREKNPRLAEDKARELTELGTRAREDGTLEWKFDPMLATLSVTGSFSIDYMRAFWAEIQAPALLINGSESGEFWFDKPGATYLEPDELERRVGSFGNGRLVEIDGAGHMLHFDRPDELLAEIRSFLQTVPA
ncbi:MAG: alpha/beta hydrolase [Candidatus Binatia bacterium]|nr:alpha/beta hydrolase [Candidatus Binatia bacterium]